MKTLTRREIAVVLADLARRAARSKNSRLNRVIFRLAACCGLRASEIAQLQVGDVWRALPRPHLRVRAGAAKGHRPRVVPLWWDRATYEDLAAWREERIRQGAAPKDAFVGSLRGDRFGAPLSRHTLRKRFRTACRALGAERLKMLTIHHGRHTFLSHALAGGRTLAEVRDAAGHANVSVTSAYLHALRDEEEGFGALFGAGG